MNNPVARRASRIAGNSLPGPAGPRITPRRPGETVERKMVATTRITKALAWACLLGAGASIPLSPAIARDDVSSKDVLTAASMEELHKLIRLQPGEYRW